MVLFKTFQTRHNYYLYDTNTNKIVKLYKKAYDYINSLEQIEEILSNKSGREPLFFKDLMDKEKILSDVNFKYRFPYDQDELLYIYKNNVQNIVLELTNKCNMRCRYCTFNNCYLDSPAYSNDIMTLDTVKKAIDFLFNNSSNNQLKIISFFGGEPLLCYDMICAAIEYTEVKYKYKNIRYNITTNLSILNDDMLHLFVNNNVYLTASIDGPREINNYNRVFINGEGSFDIVYENLMKIKSKYPDYFNKYVNVSAVLPSGKTFEKVAPFFDELGLEVFFSDMAPGTTYPFDDYIQFIDTNNSNFTVEEIKDIYFENLSKNIKIKAFSSFFKYNEAFKLSHLNNNKYCFPSGPCLPGLTRTFIQFDGEIYPCEKVNNNKSYYNIGNVFDGFDFKRLHKLISMHKDVGKKCSSCWAINKCKKCWTTIKDDDCEVQRNRVLNSLISSIETYEKYPNVIENL